MPDRFGVELRARLDGNTLHGHAAVFGQTAKLPTHYERLAPTAFKRALEAPETDVRALVNHDPRLLLGRQGAGTLQLRTDDEGLAFEVDLPDPSYAHDLRELVRRGDLIGASFAFVPGTDEWERAPDGRQIRTHTSVSALLDVSPVTYPAYDGPAVALRAFTFESANRAASQLIRARHRARIATGGKP